MEEARHLAVWIKLLFGVILHKTLPRQITWCIISIWKWKYYDRVNVINIQIHIGCFRKERGYNCLDFIFEETHNDRPKVTRERNLSFYFFTHSSVLSFSFQIPSTFFYQYLWQIGGYRCWLARSCWNKVVKAWREGFKSRLLLVTAHVPCTS